MLDIENEGFVTSCMGEDDCLFFLGLFVAWFLRIEEGLPQDDGAKVDSIVFGFGQSLAFEPGLEDLVLIGMAFMLDGSDKFVLVVDKENDHGLALRGFFWRMTERAKGKFPWLSFFGFRRL